MLYITWEVIDFFLPIILSVGLSAFVGLYIAKKSNEKIKKIIEYNAIYQNILELTKQVDCAWDYEISNLSSKETYFYEKKIACLLVSIDQAIKDSTIEIEKKEMERIIGKIRQSTTLDIEQLANEKNKNELFETKLSRNNRIENIDKYLAELTQILKDNI